MTPKVKEIYTLPIKLGEVSYKRPCVVISVLKESVTVGLISSAMDLYNETLDFLIRDDEVDFGSTGLKKKCFIKGSPLVEIPISLFVKKIGSITGEMAINYDKWIG